MPQRAATSRNEPQRAATSRNEPQRANLRLLSTNAFVFLFFLFTIPPLLAQDTEQSIFTSESLDCGTLVTDAVSPIHLTEMAECYVTVDDLRSSLVPQTLIAVSKSRTSYPAAYNLRGRYYHFVDLPLGEQFTLQYADECNATRHVGSFTTHYASKQNIEVSEDLYGLIADLSIASQEGRSEDSRAAILRSNEVDEFEKAYFFQRYYLKGRSVSDYRELLDEKSDVADQAKMSTCNCENVIHSFSLNPGQLNFITGRLVQGDLLVENDQNKLEYQLRTTGAAKAWRVYSDGKRETRNRTYGGAVGSDGSVIENENNFDNLPNDFSNEARLGMNLFCNGGATPANCGCNKKVRSRVMYESQASARAQIGSGSGSKSSFAAAEDIAIAYILRRDGTAQGDFTFLGALVSRAEEDCQQSPNEEFWSSAVNATLGIATLIASFIVPDTNSQVFTTARTQLITQIGTNLTNVITSSPTNNSGTCSSQLQAANVRRFNLQPRFTLTPNEPTELGIATRARLVSQGMRSWQSEATLVSGFSIATVHPPGLASSGDDPGCCVPFVETSYISKAHDINYAQNPPSTLPPISTQNELQAEAAQYIIVNSNHNYGFPTNSRGARYTTYEFGNTAGSNPFDLNTCGLTTERPGGIGDFRTSIGNHGDLGNLSEGLFDSQEEYQLKYYNLSGQLIGASTSLMKPTPVDYQQFLHNKSLPTGIYLVALHDQQGNRLQVQKIHITK